MFKMAKNWSGTYERGRGLFPWAGGGQSPRFLRGGVNPSGSESRCRLDAAHFSSILSRVTLPAPGFSTPSLSETVKMMLLSFLSPPSAAGNAFCQAAQLHLQLQSKHDAATNFVDAGNAFKKADPQGKGSISLRPSRAGDRFSLPSWGGRREHA